MSQTVQECPDPQPEGLVTSAVQLGHSTLVRVSDFHGSVI